MTLAAIDQRASRRIGRSIVRIAILVFTAGPFLWILATSFQRESAIFQGSIFVPSQLYFGNYVGAAHAIDLGRYLANTAFVSLGAAVVAVGLGVFAGYGLARYKLIGQRWLLLGIVATQMFPGLLLTIPLYRLLSDVGLINSLVGLVLVYTVFTVPFAVWMMRNYYLSIPREIDEAAAVDGCTLTGTLRRVILPLGAPAMVACVIFCMIVAWDDFLYASTFLISNRNWTISVGLYSLMDAQGTSWGLLMAGTVVATIPILVVFLAVQSRITGMLAGGVKG